MWSNAVTNTEERASASENDTLVYHARESLSGVIINSSSRVKQEPTVCLPDPFEEAESMHRNLPDYNLATGMEESEKNVISEDDYRKTHSGNTVTFTYRSSCTESETPQLHTVSMKMDRDAEEIESRCEMCPHASSDEDDDVSFCPDSFLDGGYEPRVDPRVLL